MTGGKMTCIVGIAHKGKTFIGGDSAGVSTHDLSLTVRNDRKVFKSGPFVMGFTSSFRMGQLLAFNFTVPAPREGTDLMSYMTGDFIDSVRARFKAGGYAEVNNGVDRGGTFLVGYKGRLFCIASDFQVGESLHGFDACGCGDLIALGALHASKGRSPKERIKAALEAAETCSAGVRRPFHIVES